MKLFLLALVPALAFAQFKTPLTVYPDSTAPSEIRLREAGNQGLNYTGWAAPGALAANVVYEMPGADGLPGQALKTDGNKVTYWSTISGSQYSVLDYGAVCDGVTDDTAAFVAAIDAGAGVQHMAEMPQGDCLVTTIDISGAYRGIRGQGRNVSRLLSTSNAPVISINPASTAYYLEFRDFSIIGNHAGTSQTGIESAGNGFAISTISNVFFEGLWRGIKIGHTANVGDINILNNTFSMSVQTIPASSLTAAENGTVYAIAYVGTTDFTLLGASANVTSAVFTKSGGTGSGTGLVYVRSEMNVVGVESSNTSSGNIWTGNFFGGQAELIGATGGARPFFVHGYLGDTTINNNHAEGGWIFGDLSCDNGTFATGTCGYGQNIISNDNKIDGMALDYRLYNIQNSTFLGNRGLGIIASEITGNDNGLLYDKVDFSGQRAGFEMRSATGDVSINGYDSGRIRIGNLASNISNTVNGISLYDDAQVVAIGIGQSPTRNVGMMWVYDATPANAYGLIYSFNGGGGAQNPLRYTAKTHTFITDGADRWTIDNTGSIAPATTDLYDIGNLTYRVRQVAATSGDFAPGGGTAGANYVSARKFNLCDEVGGTGCWYWQASGSSSSSSHTLRDNSGDHVLDIARYIAGSPVNYSFYYADFLPARRTFAGGDSIEDISTPALGNSSNRWRQLYVNDVNVQGDILFGTTSTWNIGSSSASYPLNIWGSYIEPKTQLVMGTGTSFSGDLIPDIANTRALGSTVWPMGNIYTSNFRVYNTVTAPSGSTGVSTTLSCGAGLAVKAITISGGITTSVTCGAP